MIIGLSLLLSCVVLTVFSTIEGLLGRMRVKPYAFIIAIGIIIIGCLAPDYYITQRIGINIGAAIMLLVGVICICRTKGVMNKLMAILGALLAGTGLFLLELVLPPEWAYTPFSFLQIAGIFIGIIAFLLTSGHNSALFASLWAPAVTIGVAALQEQLGDGYPTVYLGTTGTYETYIIAAIVSLILTDIAFLVRAGRHNRKQRRRTTVTVTAMPIKKK